MGHDEKKKNRECHQNITHIVCQQQEQIDVFVDASMKDFFLSFFVDANTECTTS